MKVCFLLPAIAVALWAQAPTPPAAITPETVVARIDGQPVTAADVRKFLDTAPPQIATLAAQNPSEALMALYLTHYLASEAEKLKLDQQDPWKNQIEASREQVLTTAMATHERNSWNPPDGTVEQYYQRNQLNYQQAKIKVIKLDFQPGQEQPKGASQQDLEAAARHAVEAMHPQGSRSENEAKALAGDIVKKIRAGGDFTQLVAQYSDDMASKKAGGDFGVVKESSSFPPEIKKAVLALKAGQVSDPVHVASSYYIIRVEEVSIQPINEVRSEILQTLRADHMQDYLNGLRERFHATVERPDFFQQMAPQPKPAK